MGVEDIRIIAQPAE